MFMKFKPAQRKIAMGLLSYTPEEKSIKLLLETVQKYETESSWELFLWKEKEDIVGVIGIVNETENTVRLQHLCINPSYRGEGLGRKMVEVMQQRLQKNMVPSDAVKSFLESCQQEETQST
ncbi:riboflavin biosynthesis RibT protein [Sinobaca qinghaiensis]|uniref:Riboflavin biosynthesis RibT protein n=1 Tax=Sinobaca qinghaiensis TaxID=342944 RepID=A0A419V334_9BACL|nr:GNAT family N-acetyltransferase [Sinobaca qinghaiensis]RKD72908.1 riboflavin biosynthesis RibT protein [Sinobaca qinghaiensis]